MARNRSTINVQSQSISGESHAKLGASVMVTEYSGTGRIIGMTADICIVHLKDDGQVVAVGWQDVLLADVIPDPAHIAIDTAGLISPFIAMSEPSESQIADGAAMAKEISAEAASRLAFMLESPPKSARQETINRLTLAANALAAT